MGDNDSGQFEVYPFGASCPCGLAVFEDPAIPGQNARFKTPCEQVDAISVKRKAFPWTPGLLWVVVFLVSTSFCGCTVARVGKAGLSLGASAVKTTAKVGGAAVGLAGSAIGIGSDDDDEPEEEGDRQDEPDDG